MYEPRSELVWARTLAPGMKGEDGRRLQEWLALRGFSPGVIDGDVGRLTVAAAARFRAAHGLPPGPIDPALCRALSEPLALAMRPMVFPAGTTLAAAAVARARRCAELDAHELPSNRGPWVRYFSGGVEGPSQLWCAYFVRSCLRAAAADLALSTGKQPALPFVVDPGVDRTVRNAKAGGRFIRRGSSKVFALDQSLFVVPDADGSGHRHIGFVAGPFDADEIETVEGNTNVAGSANGTHARVRTRKRAEVDYLALEADFA